MICFQCRTENRAGATACVGCGARLSPEPAGTEPGRAAFAGERRQLTALFCDIVGSTEIAASNDPEEYHEVIRTFAHCCRTVIDRFGGFIAEFRGDGALVLFGYPQSHGDEPERAIRTALTVIAAVQNTAFPGGIRVQVRIGIATGLMAVDASASNEPTAVGEALNLAARLQALAQPDTVVISELTKQLAGGFFELEDLGSQQIKGFAQPLPAWRVVEEKNQANRFEALRLPGLIGFVGRTDEVQCLLDRWGQAKTGAGQVVTISGEPGIGKSRLIKQLRDLIAGQARVLEYFGSPYHSNTALHPIVEHIGRVSGIGTGASAEARLAALRKAMGQFGGDYEDHFPWVASLMSLGENGATAHVPPQEQRQKTFAALLWWTAELAKHKPLLIIADDVHWADPTSLEYMRGVTERIRTLPILMVISFRSQFDPEVVSAHTHLALDRLDPQEAGAIVAEVTRGTSLPPELVERIVQRTDGIPLFVEELTKMVLGSDAVTPNPQNGLATSSAPRTELPATLHDLLMARLDQLPAVKLVAQMAAVIGREFLYDTLLEVSDLPAERVHAALARLLDAGLIFADTGAPDARFIFKHALVRDVAYDSLFRRDQRMLHGRVASSLEARFSRASAVDPELLAHHYTAAGLTGLALKYWQLAAQRAFQRFADVEVLAHTSKALELLAGLPDTAERRRQELGVWLLIGGASWAVKGFAAPEVEKSFTRANELAEGLGDIAQVIVASRGLFGCHYVRGELGRAYVHAERVTALAQESQNTDDMMVGRMLQGSVRFWQGEFHDARNELEAALSLYSPERQAMKLLSSQIDPAVNARLHLGWTLWSLGFPDSGLAVSEEGLASARRIGQPFSLAMALFLNSAVKLCRGEVAAVAALADELNHVTAKYQIASLSACAIVTEGAVLIAGGTPEAGVAKIKQAFAALRSQQARLGVPWAMSIAADGCLRAGMAKQAHDLSAMALASVQQNGERQWEADLHRLKGQCLAAMPGADPAEAEACVRRALDVARQQGARSLELRAATTLAWMHDARDNIDVHLLLEDIYSRFTEGFDTADVLEAKRLLDGFRPLSRRAR